MKQEDSDYLHYYVNLCLSKHEETGIKYGTIFLIVFVFSYSFLLYLIFSRT